MNSYAWDTAIVYIQEASTPIMQMQQASITVYQIQEN